MDINIQEKVDNLLNEINAETDLNKKIEHLYYVLRQADYLIWSLQEEQHQYENNNSF
ncbi:MAG: hypothetical protein IJT04_09510 [Bacteroidales bacterium]|nr:hypothetical protein [Bacteroidales bacterium]